MLVHASLLLLTKEQRDSRLPISFLLLLTTNNGAMTVELVDESNLGFPS